MLTAPRTVGLRALVVDDEPALTDVVASYLRRDGFEVEIAHTGTAAITSGRAFNPDAVILDVGLPGLDGFEVCRQLRTFSDAYVIMLTARDSEIDTVVGLSLGADDYITKPFSPRELMARLQAIHRRPRRGESAAVPGGQRREFGSLSIDVDARVVRVGGHEIALTRLEFDILDALSARPGAVLRRGQLIEEVWGEHWITTGNVVDAHIAHLRRKLGDDAGRPRFVTTVRGVGYRMGKG